MSIAGFSSLTVLLGLGFEYTSAPPVLIVWDAAGILLLTISLALFGLSCIIWSVFPAIVFRAIVFTIIIFAIVPVILVIIVFRIVAIIRVAKVERVELVLSDPVVALDVPRLVLLQNLVRSILFVNLVRSNLRCVL